ncbi:MAG: hypothetical protein IJT19_00385 [Bacteroidaceae bacterium]|nr:hypothetical protein [Bacteroidaceae bacterium]
MNTKLVGKIVGTIVGFAVAFFVVKTCSKNPLEQAVEQANKECPVEIDLMTTMHSVELDGKEVVLTFLMDEYYINMELLANNPESMKENVMATYANPNDEMKSFLKLMVNSGANVRIVYKGKDTGETAEVTLSTDELKNCLSGKTVTPEERLMAEVQMANQIVPIELGNGVTMSYVSVEKETVFYVYEIDEAVMSLDEFKENYSFEVIKDNIKASQTAEREFYVKVADTGRGLGYRYTGTNSADKQEYIIPNNELVELLHK